MNYQELMCRRWLAMGCKRNYSKTYEDTIALKLYLFMMNSAAPFKISEP